MQQLKEELRVKTEELERLTHENAGYKRREAKKDLAISRFEQMIAEGTKSSPVAQRILQEAAHDEAADAAPAGKPKLLRKGLFKKSASAPPPEAQPVRPKKANKLTQAIQASRQGDQAPAQEPAPASQPQAEPLEENAQSADGSAPRVKRRKVLSLAKRIKALQEEADS